MPNRQRTLFLLLAAVTVASCSRQRVLVPPMVDLKSHVRIGLVTFTSQGAKGSLAAFATQRFSENLLRAQPGIEILELGVIEGAMDAAMARKLGEQHKVKTLMVGHLVVSDVKPRLTILGGVSASAEATLSLSTRLLSAESGSTLWSQSSRIRETIAAFSMVGGVPVFDAKDPADAYGNIVNQLVWTLTTDFRSTWVKQ